MDDIQKQITDLEMKRCFAVLDKDYNAVRDLDHKISELRVHQSNLLINQLWPGALVVDPNELSK